jgi:ribosomal-protein-alanine N-acetyltransferase
MIRRDMPMVLAIEEASFEFPWSEEDFLLCLRQRNCIGMVAELNDEVVGYMVYELHKHRLHLLNFAVSPSCRRIGIGRAMIETNLAAQLFFRSIGFRAEKVLSGFYEDSDDDAYVFTYRMRS